MDNSIYERKILSFSRATLFVGLISVILAAGSVASSIFGNFLAFFAWQNPKSPVVNLSKPLSQEITIKSTPLPTVQPSPTVEQTPSLAQSPSPETLALNNESVESKLTGKKPVPKTRNISYQVIEEEDEEGMCCETDEETDEITYIECPEEEEEP